MFIRMVGLFGDCFSAVSKQARALVKFREWTYSMHGPDGTLARLECVQPLRTNATINSGGQTWQKLREPFCLIVDAFGRRSQKAARDVKL